MGMGATTDVSTVLQEIKSTIHTAKRAARVPIRREPKEALWHTLNDITRTTQELLEVVAQYAESVDPFTDEYDRIMKLLDETRRKHSQALYVLGKYEHLR
jgi:vacuolar-type H+-ATPase subunit I/STV1